MREQITMPLDQAIQLVVDKCTTLEAAFVAQIKINKLLLQALADTHEGSHHIIRDELRKYADESNDEAVKLALSSMADSIVDRHQASHDPAPRLRLVPSPPEESPREDQEKP